jgi:hypothetical protein
MRGALCLSCLVTGGLASILRSNTERLSVSGSSSDFCRHCTKNSIGKVLPHDFYGKFISVLIGGGLRADEALGALKRGNGAPTKGATS